MSARPRSKTRATWLTLLGGTFGLHRFWRHGLRDAWGWLHLLATLTGLAWTHGMIGLYRWLRLRPALAPLLLPLAERVECSAYDAAVLPAIEARHRASLPSAEAARMHWSQRDLRALVGRWDLIVMKSVLGGVHRTHNSRLADVHATLERLRTQHLRPGGGQAHRLCGRGPGPGPGSASRGPRPPGRAHRGQRGSHPPR